MTTVTARPTNKGLVASAVAAVLLVSLAGLGFVLGRGTGQNEYLSQRGDPYTGEVVGYKSNSICVVPDGSKVGSCGLPLLDDAAIKVGSHVEVIEFDLTTGESETVSVYMVRTHP